MYCSQWMNNASIFSFCSTKFTNYCSTCARAIFLNWAQMAQSYSFTSMFHKFIVWYSKNRLILFPKSNADWFPFDPICKNIWYISVESFPLYVLLRFTACDFQISMWIYWFHWYSCIWPMNNDEKSATFEQNSR